MGDVATTTSAQRLILPLEFVDMLNEMRFGQLSQSSIAKFHKLKRQPKYADGLEPTEL